MIDWLIDWLIDWYFLFVCSFGVFRPTSEFFNLVLLVWGFFHPTREFFNLVLFGIFRPTDFFSLILRRHHCWWRAANLTYAQHSWPLSSEGSLACLTYWLKIGSSILNPMWVIGSNSSYQRDCAVKSRMEMELFITVLIEKKIIRRREHWRANFAGRSTQRKCPHVLNTCLRPQVLNICLTCVKHMLRYTYL